MRTSTLILTELALRHGGVRAAARAAEIPQSSVSSALSRFEQILPLPLLRRIDTGVAPTLEASRLLPQITELAMIARAIHGIGLDQAPSHPLSFSALFRLAQAVRLGSIRRAATEMELDQPHLTRQIAKIEEHHGAPLLLRAPQGITPTAEGRRVLDLIEQLETGWRNFTAAPAPQHSNPSRHLSLGTIIPATAHGHMAHFIASLVSDLYFRRKVRVTLASAIAEELLEGLDSKRFDVIVIDTDLDDPSYRQHELSRSPVGIFGRDLPQDPSDPSTLLRALARNPFVLQSRRSGLRQRAESYLDAHASRDWRNTIPIIEVDSLPVIVSMVESGAFNSLLPEHVGAGLIGVSGVGLPPAYDQRMQLTWRSSPRAERLAQMIVDWATGPVPPC